MGKEKTVRVYQLAKELGIPNAEILEELTELKIEVKNHMSVIPDEVANTFRKIHAEIPAVKPEVKKETVKPVKEPEKQIIKKTNLTPEEQALASLISSEGNEWKTISEDELNDFSLSQDQYQLSEKAARLQNEKKFAFHWAERNPARIELLRSARPPQRWMIVNGTTIPELANEVDITIGGIVRLDMILMFKPWSWHQRMKDAQSGIARAKDEAGDISKLDGQQEEWGEYQSGQRANISPTAHSIDEVSLEEAA